MRLVYRNGVGISEVLWFSAYDPVYEWMVTV